MSRRAFLELSGSTALLAAAGCAKARPGRPAPQNKTKIIRMAVVGGGFGASFYWHEHPYCNVTAVTDLRQDRRDILRDRYKCDSVYDSLEQMLKKANDIDAVAIFVPEPGTACTLAFGLLSLASARRYSRPRAFTKHSPTGASN